MRFFGHLDVSLLITTLFVFITGGEGNESARSQFEILNRGKRSLTYSCSTVNALQKYISVPDHTACISASSNLVSGTAGVTDEEKVEIVTTHNNYRSGTTATDMMLMSWDEETAYIAQKWAENCQFQHENGFKRRIPGRFSLGQNLAISSNKRSWADAIKPWYDEISDFTYNSGSNILSQVGHYTQVVWAKSIKIGCGYAKCSNINHFYVCNYGPAGNIDINVPYTAGSSCAACPGNCQNNLCNCDRICLNGGTLDLATCTCSCKTGYSGTDCSLDCNIKNDRSMCQNSYSYASCAQLSNIPEDCPTMCQYCPNAGTGSTGTTDGRGNVPFSLTADGGGGGASCIHGQNKLIICTIMMYLLLRVIS